MLRFFLAGLFFHAVLLAVTAALVLRWQGRLAKPRPAWLWVLFLLADATLFGLAILIPAGLAGGFAPMSFFSAARFMSQGFFAEGLLLLLALAALHARAGLRGRTLLLAGMAAALVVTYWEAYHRCPYDLRVRRHTVDLSRGSEAGRFTLLHMSDLQTHAIRPYEERALALARELRPDLIVFTGDYIQPRLGATRKVPAADLNALLRRLDLNPRLGAYAVRGDTELDGWQEMFAGTRFQCLEDAEASVPLKGERRLTLAGLSLGSSRSGQSALLDAPSGDGVRIVAGHSPDFVRGLPEGHGVDLALAGHTHGGQIALPFFGPPVTFSRLPRRYAGGLNRYRGLPLHVSRGIGMERITAPEVRFLCPPEITLLEVRY